MPCKGRGGESGGDVGDPVATGHVQASTWNFNGDHSIIFFNMCYIARQVDFTALFPWGILN